MQTARCVVPRRDTDSAVVFKYRGMNVLDTSATTLAKRGVELVMSEFGPRKDILVELAIVDEKLRTAFDCCRQTLAAIGGKAHEPVGRHQRRRRHEASDQRVVPSVHRVLESCVGEHEKEHKVKGCELADLTLARESEQRNEKDIDHNTDEQSTPTMGLPA